jgi:hypothetical protein
MMTDAIGAAPLSQLARLAAAFGRAVTVVVLRSVVFSGVPVLRAAFAAPSSNAVSPPLLVSIQT